MVSERQTIVVEGRETDSKDGGRFSAILDNKRSFVCSPKKGRVGIIYVDKNDYSIH